MNRKYTTAQFKGIVDGLREAFDDVAITTDIMVGFLMKVMKNLIKQLNLYAHIKFADASCFPIFATSRNTSRKTSKTKFHRT